MNFLCQICSNSQDLSGKFKSQTKATSSVQGLRGSCDPQWAARFCQQSCQHHLFVSDSHGHALESLLRGFVVAASTGGVRSG